jgi:hypothetical protein
MRGPQVTGARRAIGALAMLGALAAGCGAQDAGSTPFAGTIVYQDKDGGFALNLLEPPWLPLIATPEMTIFVVPPTNATVTADLSVVLDEALFSLVVAPEASSPAVAAQMLSSSLPAAAMVEEANFTTYYAAAGIQITWREMLQDGLRYHRDAFVAGAGPSASTYHLAFTAKSPITADAMVGQMITSFVAYH